jgi:hypothetical protein
VYERATAAGDVTMKNYLGIVALFAVIAGAYLFFHSVGLDLRVDHVEGHFVVVPITVFLFWLSIGITGLWLVIRVIRRSMRTR